MVTVYRVTLELSAKFKEPFGVLIRGSFAETMKRLKVIVEKEKPLKIVAVGDRVTRNLHEHGMPPDVSVTDDKCMRKKIQPITFDAGKVVCVGNPQGTITEEAIAAVRDAVAGDSRVHVKVDGEEDLLTLIAVLYAPEKSLVVYGQPKEGIVVVEVTPEKKAEAAKILKAMETVRKAK